MPNNTQGHVVAARYLLELLGIAGGPPLNRSFAVTDLDYQRDMLVCAALVFGR